MNQVQKDGAFQVWRLYDFNTPLYWSKMFKFSKKDPARDPGGKDEMVLLLDDIYFFRMLNKYFACLLKQKKMIFDI